jgi:hypothetical protein
VAWLSQLATPTCIEITAGEEGLHVYLYTQPGVGQGGSICVGGVDSPAKSLEKNSAFKNDLYTGIRPANFGIPTAAGRQRRRLLPGFGQSAAPAGLPGLSSTRPG